MKRLLWLLALLVVPAILAGAGLYLIHTPVRVPAGPSATAATVKPTASPSPSATGRPGGRPRAAQRQAARHRHHHTGPWAVVSAYYRAVDARKYAKAWALIGPAMAARQTYQQFVSGYACTGTERPTRLSQSGPQVSFNLTVANTCTAAFQYYTGTDTVRGGKIVAAEVTRTG